MMMLMTMMRMPTMVGLGVLGVGLQTITTAEAASHSLPTSVLIKTDILVNINDDDYDDDDDG